MKHGFLHTFANSSTSPAENIDMQKIFIQILATQILVEILILDVSAVMLHVLVLFFLARGRTMVRDVGEAIRGNDAIHVDHCGSSLSRGQRLD